MPLGPVFRHEMIAAGRKRRYMVLRVLVGAILLALLGMCYSSAHILTAYDGMGESTDGGLSIAAISRLTAQFYSSFAWWTLFGVLLVTPAIAAGAIATERERRTIEYLFATDLSNSEIVLDKMAARLLTVGQIVLAAFPLLAIFRLLGGVPGDLVLVHFATLASSATLVAAISIAVSTWCERSRDAVPRAYTNVFLLLFAPMLVQGFQWVCSRIFPTALSDWLATWITEPLAGGFLAINPIYVLATAGGVSSGALGVDLDLSTVGWMIAGQLLFAAACLALCIFAVRRVHLNASGRGKIEEKKASIRPDSLPWESNPVLWREIRSSTRKTHSIGGVGTLLMAIIVAIAVIVNLSEAMFSINSSDWEDYFQFAATTVGFLSPIILLLLGCRAAGLVTYEKESETWLSLLTTPLSAKEIVHGKLLGNLWAYRWPLVALAAIPAAGLIVRGDTWLATLGVLLTTSVIAWAASAIGLLISLWCKSSLKAIGITVAVLVGIGGGYLPFVFLFAATMGLNNSNETIILLSPCVPFLCVVPVILQFDTPGDAPVLATYMMGTIGYAGLAFVATLYARERFDQLCERSNGEWQNNAMNGEAPEI